MGHLTRFEDHLSVLHKMIHQEEIVARGDAPAKMWTWSSVNKGKFKEVLKDMDKYRQQVLPRLVGTSQTLHTMIVEMEELRRKVAAPDVVRGCGHAEIQVTSIEMSVERLRLWLSRYKERQEENIARVTESIRDRLASRT